EVSCRVDLPSVHIPKVESRARKTFCAMRDSLGGARTKVINTVRGWLRGQGRRLGKGSRVTFTDRVRAACGAELPGYVERQLRVGAAAARIDHGRRAAGAPLGARSGGVGTENAVPAAGRCASASVGASERAPSREANCDGGAGTQAGGDPLRDVARQYGLRW